MASRGRVGRGRVKRANVYTFFLMGTKKVFQRYLGRMPAKRCSFDQVKGGQPKAVLKSPKSIKRLRHVLHVSAWYTAGVAHIGDLGAEPPGKQPPEVCHFAERSGACYSPAPSQPGRAGGRGASVERVQRASQRTRDTRALGWHGAEPRRKGRAARAHEEVCSEHSERTSAPPKCLASRGRPGGRAASVASCIARPRGASGE